MKITGNLIITKENQNDFKKLKEVSGYVYVRQGATFTAPALEKSGYVDVQEGATFTAPALKISKEIANLNNKSFKVKLNDGICFYSESEKTSKGIKIYSGLVELQITDNKVIGKPSFLVEKEGFSAHGETVKKAMSDLQFKIIAEKLKNQPIYADTVISDNYYRTVTGACELGVASWRKQNGILKETITAKELLPILEKTNAYGLERFKKLISF